MTERHTWQSRLFLRFLRQREALIFHLVHYEMLLFERWLLIYLNCRGLLSLLEKRKMI